MILSNARNSATKADIVASARRMSELKIDEGPDFVRTGKQQHEKNSRIVGCPTQGKRHAPQRRGAALLGKEVDDQYGANPAQRELKLHKRHDFGNSMAIERDKTRKDACDSRHVLGSEQDPAETRQVKRQDDHGEARNPAV